MEEILLMRLRGISRQMEALSEEAVACLKEDNDKAEVISVKLDLIIQRFNTELYNYFRLSQDPSVDEISDFSTIQLRAEELFAELKVKLKKNVSMVSSQGQICSKLPKLNLAEFDGDILGWSTFWDQFSSNIDSRNLSDVDKLLYLKSALKGEAKRAIDGLETNNKNYSIAVTTLKERYGKENQIIDAHYSALYKIKTSENTVTDCRRALNEIERHLRVLSSLGENINHNHLRFLILEKLPEDIVYELKMKMQNDSIDEMRKHLEIIVTAREDANRMSRNDKNGKQENYTVETLHTTNNSRRQAERRKGPKQVKKNKVHGRTQVNTSTFNNEKKHQKRSYDGKNGSREEGTYRKKLRFSCIFCDGSHYNESCEKVQSLQDRKEKLGKRCYCCLRLGHISSECRSKKKCVHCGKATHNRALCLKMCTKNVPSKSKTETSTTLHLNTRSTTILQTAIVKVKRDLNSSKRLDCRILLDTGSQRSYVTQRIAKELDLPIEEEHRLSVFTFGSTVARELESPVVRLHMETRTNKGMIIFANVVPIISQGVPYHGQELNCTDGVMADDGSLSDRVDILIGNDLYCSLVSSERIKIKENLFLINSNMGWILSGKTDTQSVDQLSVVTYFQLCSENKLNEPDLPLDNGSIKSLWDLESIGITDSPKISRDEEAIKNFNDTTEVVDNRYTVSWPWKENVPDLPTNYGIAYGRLVSLLKRLDNDTLETYDLTLKDQMKKKIIEVVPTSAKGVTDHPIHYLPHHGVSQPGKQMRIVYDASAKTKDNKSLNECLYCGPLMLEELTELLIRFRTHPIGITADVEKAFLQIALHDKDRDVTRFLWLKDTTKAASEDNLLHMRFCRVPFGIIASPFLLNATIRHHLLNSDEQSIKEIANDIYVDNLVTGVNRSEDAMELYNNCKRNFEGISMNLREWSSNSKDFIKYVPDSCNDDTVNVLGLEWNTITDTLQLRLKDNTHAKTKRGVLKTIASIYDPCGFAVPSVLPAKLFLQKLWKIKVKWDSKLSPELTSEWTRICKDLENISDITLQRRFIKDCKKEDYTLHCFTDASMQAYAAVIYIVYGKNKSFVIGKSRLVPIKDQDNLKIPRLELLAVLIGSRMLKYIGKALKQEIKQQYLWTDSQIVISWCNSNKLLPPFVARRVEEINHNKNVTMRFVPTELNPADIATRPTATALDKIQWLEGPDFLLEKQAQWPTGLSSQTFFLQSGEGLSNDTEMDYENTSNENLPGKENETNKEQIEGTPDINNEQIKGIQSKYFTEEISGKETNLSRNLRLFIDDNGILRCKGRMCHTDWSYDKKYPILLPKDSELTSKIVKDIHERNYHVGVSHTLSLIRQTYWIPHGRSQVKRILSRCPRCVKHGGGPYRLPATPALPAERVNYSSPFTCVGVDYFGPVYTSGTETQKRWICLFTCLAVRAIHMEVVKDLTAEECLLALRRFTATRGRPAMIVSDNALQFKLVSEVIITNHCKENGITWRFIPQLAPWHGGFYERMVGIVKHCLKRSLSKHLLNDSQLHTVIKEVEMVVNTRPLTCVGEDIEHVLTPADFLCLGKCLSIEVNEDILGNETVRKRDLIEGWKRGQRILDEFKHMFVNQYLLSLRERYNNSVRQPRVKAQRPPSIDDVVQIKGDSKNRENWRVGKITSFIPGADGECRVARVKVGNSEFIRSIAHLYPLETDDDENVPKETVPVKYRSNAPGRIVTSGNQDDEYAPNDTVLNKNLNDETAPDEITFTENYNENNDETAPDKTAFTKNSNDETAPKEVRTRRDAATRALEKIREWTRNLITLL